MAATATASSAGVRYAPEDPTLPKPWKGLVDSKTGYLYFWNPETNVTQYERPTGSAPPKPAFSVSSSVQVQKVPDGPRNGYSRDGGSDNFNGKGSAAGFKPELDPTNVQGPQGGTVHSVHGGASAKRLESSSVQNNISAEAYRRQHEITVTGVEVPDPFTSFEATNFPSELLREVHNAGFSAPTPIQAQSWPVALQSRDIVAIAKTGSGKTLGYLVPAFIHLKRVQSNPQLGPTVLVLSPTRELATQIQDEAVKFGKSLRISCTCLYGGAPKGPQLRDLDRGVNIVVATPGRLNDILEMRRISLNQVSYLVLDEADRMLDMGFEPQIRKIVKEVPARRQTLMYTATWPKEVRKIAADLLVNPVQVNIGNVDELVANKSITQHIEVLVPLEKHRRLEQILRSQEPGSKIIIFCSTKKMCDQLARNLNRQFGAAAIHGDKSQSERDYVLNQFRTGRAPVLVATDVAARGLDIKDIRVVVNYDFPTGVEDYVHRIGRTGRAGATGVAYTFFGDQDAKHASDLIKLLEGANQRVPPQIREMASRSGGGFGGRFRRWGSGPGGRDGGRGGRGDSSFGGRDGGRGGWSKPERGFGRGSDFDSHDRYNRGRSPSPSAHNVSSWGDRNKSFSRDRSRSRSRSPDMYGRAGSVRSSGRSFHQAMMEQAKPSHSQRLSNYDSETARDNRNASSPPTSKFENPGSSSPFNGGGGRGNFGGSSDGPSRGWGAPPDPKGNEGSFAPGHHSYDGEEEGMISAADDNNGEAK